ncbi:Reticulon-domain-containing protein [Corynascus novoguineensis]|uniref:Reticulon-like protein n=1 Tax=Corynascus novoguineensis TaxID=1126955 RepID=A0AAN7CWE5_9PEZI|nr:Reticulon-domain-containing protein [Corynascus novoguineensis]
MADSTAVNGNSNTETLKASPVAQNVLDQSSKASAEISNLAASRHPPSYTAATGQPLTNYHSFFSELLSWRNPRASAIAYASLVTFIFSVRYLDLIRWALKLTWMVLGITIAAEVAGKALLNNGFATQLRPRKYYTIPRETLEMMIGDVHELINFFVIESQRVLFAENVYASAAAALAAFISYYLVKIVPYWGLAVIATTVVFFTPLIYTTNQELIDSQLKHASEVVNAQTAQLCTVAQKHTAQATQVTKQYMGDYTAKAQALIKGGRHHEQPQKAQAEPQEATSIKATDFPAPPREDIKLPADVEPVSAPEPVVKTDGEPLVAA